MDHPSRLDVKVENRTAHSGASRYLFLHGQPGSGKDWQRIIRRLPTADRYLVLDRPGWGMSTLKAQGVFSNARIISSYISKNSRDKFTLVAHSFGAAVALALVQLAPQYFDGLLLISPASNREALVLLDRVLGAPMLGRMGAQVVGGLTKIMRDQLGWGTNAGESFLLEQTWMLRELEEIETFVFQLEIPTVIIGGTSDRVIPFGSYQILSASLANSQLIGVNTSKHNLMTHRPGDVMLALSELKSKKNQINTAR